MKYVIKNSDGSVSVATLLDGKIEDILQEGQEVVENWDGVMPDRYFRESWSVNRDKLEVDLVKARAAKMVEIRAERNKRLEATDVEFQVELSKNMDLSSPEIAQIAAKKQELRDLPPLHETALEDITNLEELKAYNIDTALSV